MADVNISKFRASVVRDGSKPASPGFVVSEGQDPVNPPGTNNFVPYTGATANVELGEYGVESGFVTLDTTPTNTPTDQGTIYWDDAKSTAALIMNGTTQHIGQDTFFYVKNSTGSTIAKGTAVRFDGTDGGSGHLKIAPFLADGTYPSSYFMGVTSEEITNGSFGQVMHFGELDGINTSGYTAGDLLYASSTVAGGFQTTAPVAPNNIVLVAAAINSKNNGAIIVRPQIGSNINNDEGVKITSPTTGDLLQLQAGGLWENKTLAQVIGSAYVPSTRTITINGTTQDLSANRTFNVGTVTSVGLSSATSGVTIGSTPVTTSGTITLAIATASGSQQGLLSAADWTTFNNKQNALGFTPVPNTRTITINGTALDLSVDRSWSVGDMLLNTYQVVTGTKIFGPARLIMEGEGTAQPTSLANTQLSNSALSSHNSFGFNDSNNIYFNKGTTANGGIFAFSNSATRTYTLKDASGTLAFTSDIPTNPVGGTGTTNYLPKFTGASTIGNSAVSDDGTSVTILSRIVGINGASESGWGLKVYENLKVQNNNGTTVLQVADTASGGKVWSLISSGLGNSHSVPAGTFYLRNSSDGLTALQVAASGNLGLGVTPSAWLGVYKAIQVGNTSSFFSVGSQAYLGNNAFVNSSDEFAYITSTNASIYRQNVGTHSWFTAPSGTAGNAISFTQAMTLFSTGNLLVGTPSPISDNGARLQVSGTATISSSLTAVSLISASATFSNFGSATAAVVAFADGNTGFFRPALNTLGITTAGSERLRITSDGDILLKSRSTTTNSEAVIQNTNSAFSFYGSQSGSVVKDITFHSGGTAALERLRITSDGTLGFNGSSSIGNAGLDKMSMGYLNSNYGWIQTWNGTKLILNGLGNEVLVGGTTDNGAYNLQCNGTGVWGAGAYVNGSDRNIKDNIATIEKGLEYIQKMNPVKFRYKPNYTRDHSMQTGFIAQELQEVFASEDYLSGLVQQGVHLSVAYQNLLPVMVKAIQELKQEIDTLKN